MAFGVLSGVKDRLTEMQLGRGEGALKRDKPQAALDIFGKVIESLEDRYKEESEMPDSARALYGRALLLRARALAMNRNVNAVAAYLRARQRVPLEEDDIEFVADHLISTLPRTFMAFPVYVDWYERASDPMDAEAKLRHIARIETDEDAGDSLFDIKHKLNEYFAAHFPSWLWTLEHLANSYEIRGDMDASHSCLVEWRVRDPENATVRCRERIVAAKRHLQNRQTLEALSAYEAAMLSGGDEASDAAYQLLAAAQQTRLGRPQIRRIRRTFEQYALHTKDAELLAEYALWIDAFDTAASLSMFRRVLEIDPTHDRSLWELAKREYQRNEPKHALDLAERYLDRNPTDERARAFAAHIAGERGDYERVIDLMEAVSHHTSTQALLFGEALMKADRFEDAATALDDIDAEDLDDADLVRLECLRADIAFERGEFESAVERYSTLLEDHPDDATLWTRLGRTYLRQGEWKEAAKTFTKALEVDEHAYIARNGRAQAFYRYGDTDAAAKDFRRSLMTNPRQPNTLYAIARCVMRKQPDLAKSFLVRAVDERPDFRAAWLALARLHENGENWSGAAHAYSQIIEQDEKAGRTRDAAISNRHAHVSMRGGDFKTAKAILEARLEQGEDETLLYYLGYCCYHTGDLKGAAERWRASLLRRDDPALRTDLAWLHIRLADASLARDNRVEMIQHWNTARETLPDDVMEGALIQRWAKEALTRLKNRPTPRDVQNAHDLMTDVLHHEPDNPSYQMIAALCAARVGDWGLAEEIIKPLTRDEWWMNPATYLLGVCRHEQNLFDPAVAILDAKRDWGRWEVEAQSLMVQVHLDADDIEGTARELAMLRAMSPEACSADAAVSVFLNMKCWRHARELIQDAPVDARTPFMHYGLAVSALMTQRETEGLDYLDQVTEDSEWHSQAQALRKIGYKRRALRAFQTLGWEEVVESLEQVMETDESDDTVPLWLERARDFAILSRWDAHDGDRIVERWRARLGKEPRNIRPLHQWAVFAYWMAQTQPSPERWRAAMSLWGTLLNQSQYWQAWASARLRRHDPNTWGGASLEEQSWQLQPIIRNLRSKLMTQLTTDMTDATLRIKGTPDELDDLLGDFLREYQTAELWHEWLESNPHLRDSVLPYGAMVLDVIDRLDEVRSILTTGSRLQATPLGERLLIYLSPLGSILAAAETENERLARDRAQRLFDSSDPETRRYARIIFALATRNAESLVKTPREGLEVTLKARLCASEVSDSALIGQVDWRPLFARFADGLVAEVEDSSRRLPQDRIEEASSARDLLKRVYELTKIDSVIPSIVKITIFQARSLVTLGRKAVLPTDNTYFGEYDAEALDLLHETLSLAPDHVLLQQETAQLRLRRGLVAAERGRLNEALIDFARAHELDPVSHRIATTYANFMMEQANRMWMDPRPESQREALSLAYRVLSTNPADAQLLSRCSRFLDLPDAHELRSTPEYRRLATLFLRYAHDGSHE